MPSTETVGLGFWPESAAPRLARGVRLADRYDIVRHLGSGGTADVYAAHDVRLRQLVAIKLLRRDRINERSLKRLEREAKLARQSNSPHLVRVYDVAECEHGPFIVMELIEGPTLRALMETRAVSADEAVRILRQTAEALAAIHELGIVHRDVKPSNLLMDAGGNVKLADFGLAYEIDSDESRLTQSSAIVGTREYFSPEQALGEELDARTDLFSLGLVAFEMLAGRLPFAGRSSIGAMVALVQHRAPDVRRVRAGVPRWLARLVARLLERDRARRFASAGELLVALRSRRIAWRPRIGVAAAVIMVVTAALGVGGWRYFATRFARLVSRNGALVAVDRGDRALWSVPDQQANYAVLRSKRGPRVALIEGAMTPEINESKYRLQLIEAQSGRVLRTIAIPKFDFPGFSSTFSQQKMTVVDLDHDGADEAVISYLHSPLYPSFTVYYDPAEDQARQIFVGSGHHRFLAACDLDGDGRDEVILGGVNNVMGWYSSVAAVDVPPASREPNPVTFSPDFSWINARPPRWYALLHGWFPDPDHPPSIDAIRRRIVFHLSDGRNPTLMFDGFAPGVQTSPNRSERRKRAYDELREAVRLGDGGFYGPAFVHADAGIAWARESGDATALEWARRVRARLLVRSGRVGEGEAAAAAIAEGSEARSEVAFDAGRDLACRGELTRAVHWFREGLGPGGAEGKGRARYEFVEGMVLSLVQLRKFEEAKAEIVKFERAFGSGQYSQRLLEYVDWREGHPRLIVLTTPNAADIVRLIHLETLAAIIDAPGAILQELNALLPLLSESKPLALSLRAELLERLGRGNEALGAAYQARETSQLELGYRYETRLLHDVVLERFIRIAAAHGRAGDAEAARLDLRRFLAENR